MKQFKLFSLAALALAASFTACSSDDNASENTSEKPVIDGAYVSFNIVQASGTRATEGDYEAGSKTENEIKSVLCVFYNRDGSFADSTTPTISFKRQDASPNVEELCDATVVLSGKAINARKALIILNDTANTIKAALDNKTLSQAYAVIENYGNGEGKKPFVMSNTTYLTSSPDYQIYCATPIEEANICKTEAEAVANPIDVYVERLQARIDIDLTDVQVNDTTISGVTGLTGAGNITVHPVVAKFSTVQAAAVCATTEKMYLLKNIDDYENWSFASTWTKWNSEQNKRCFWANTDGKVTVDGWVAFPKANTAQQPQGVAATGQNFGTAKYYVQENTNSAEAKQTKVIVFANLVDGDGNPMELVKCNGANYTADSYVTLLAEKISEANVRYIDTDDNGAIKNFPPAAFEIVRAGKQGNKAYECKIALTTAYENYNLATGSDSDKKAYGTQTDINNIINSHIGRYWKDGRCYYYVPVEHFGTQADPNDAKKTIPLNGVVRNHVYKVKINSISGLGTPVFDPDEDNPEPIIPERPSDEDWYLAAKINVLKWKVVNQSVDLR